MSYMEAFQIGWSILWRFSAWLFGAALLLLGLRSLSYRPAGAVATIGPILLFYIFPRIIRGLPDIRYRDFHLALSRPRGGPGRLTWLESLLLLFSICLVNGFFAAPLHWFLRETYQFIVLLFYPFVVAAPLAAFVLANFPSSRFDLEIERDIPAVSYSRGW